MSDTDTSGADLFRGGMGDAALRSPPSIDFEKAWSGARGDRAVPLRKDIGLKTFARFAPSMAIIEPDFGKPALPFRLVGSGFFDFFGTDITGVDYLTLVDPAIADDAYACVRALMAKPCGLWQFTPVLETNGKRSDYEYTIFPISKGEGEADCILIYVHHELTSSDAMPEVDRFEGAEIWHWIDADHGIPPLSAPFL